MLGLDPATPTRRRLYGRLAAIFFLGGGLLSIATLPISPPDLSKIGTLEVGLIAIAIGAVSWFAPWDRWRRSASLALVPPGFALIAAGNLLGGSDYHTYGIFFVVAFLWMGIAHPPRTSLFFAPLGAVAYALPLYYLPGSVANGLVAGVITLGVCLLVGEALSRGAEHLRSAEAALRAEAEESRRLRELDEVKTTFLHAVSHDLRAPLMSMMGSAATIQRSEPNLAHEEVVGLAGVVIRNGNRLERMLEDLLDLDRIDRGIVEPKREATDLGALTRDMVRQVEGLRGRVVHLEAPSVVAELDPGKVERIVENLLINAARHTPKEAAIWVSVEDQEGGVLISVEDSGPGIPSDVRPTLFEPFSKGKRGPYAPGLGIGLSLVARFAEMHGGRAWVEDRPGGGASFRVLIPEAPEEPVVVETEGATDQIPVPVPLDKDEISAATADV